MEKQLCLEGVKTEKKSVLGRAPRGTVIICPGGGYRWLSEREAAPVARMFLEAGWNAAVLYYPVNSKSTEEERPGKHAFLAAAAAVADAREMLPQKPVIVCGFSAGGNVAATLGVHWNDTSLFSDPAMQKKIRPDGLILCYPVITAGQYAHRDSFRNLTEEKEESYFSAELHVNEMTPPTFLWHTAEDALVPVENSLLFAKALAKHHVPFELHVYPFGVHGLSLATKEVDEPEKGRIADAHVAKWARNCTEWLNIMFQETESN